MKRFRWAPIALLAAGLLTAGCSQKKDDGTAPTSEQKSLPPLTIRDDTPDLLYLNFKEIDYVGHVWSMNSPEMTDAVRYQDEALKRFVPFLDQQVGKGNWAMVITADHAAMPNPTLQPTAGSLEPW